MEDTTALKVQVIVLDPYATGEKTHKKISLEPSALGRDYRHLLLRVSENGSPPKNVSFWKSLAVHACNFDDSFFCWTHGMIGIVLEEHEIECSYVELFQFVSKKCSRVRYASRKDRNCFLLHKFLLEFITGRPSSSSSSSSPPPPPATTTTTTRTTRRRKKRKKEEERGHRIF